jgi:hypothetical protein
MALNTRAAECEVLKGGLTEKMDVAGTLFFCPRKLRRD